MEPKYKNCIYLGTIVIALITLVLLVAGLLQSRVTSEQSEENFSYQEKLNTSSVKAKNSDESTKIPLVWREYRNSIYGFEVEYPSDFLLDENFADAVEYSINFGPQYSLIFGKNHPRRSSADGFMITVFGKNESIADLIREHADLGSQMERKLVVMPDESINELPLKVVKSCSLDDNCEKIAYFLKNDVVYSITLKNYYSASSLIERGVYDKMFASLRWQE